MANPAIKTGKGLLDMLFMHNTSAEKLRRAEKLGGFPMPSVAATKKDIPFEDFGDITLVGKPESFDPANKLNPMFNADAYTVRAPRPVRIAKKDAVEKFKAEYEPIDGSRARSKAQELGYLSEKRNVRDSDYGNMEGFFESDNLARIKYLNEKGIKFTPNRFGFVDYNDWVKLVDPEEHSAWVGKQLDKYFEPEEYFTKINNVGNVTLEPYTLDNVTKHMQKSVGKGQESVFMGGSTAEQRANLAEQIKSIAEAKNRKGSLMPADETAETYEGLKSLQWDLMEALKPYYKYDADGFGYLDDTGSMLLEANKRGLRGSMKEYGFENVPDSLIKEIEDWRGELSKAPVQYFESKPSRPVGLEEFGGAIVPENTPQGVLDMLANKGLRVEKYGDEAGRTAARGKFQDLMFQYGIPAATVSLGSGALGMMSPEEQLFAAPIQPQEPQPSMLDSVVTGAKRGFYKANSPEGFYLGLMDALGAQGAGEAREKLAQSKYKDDEEQNQLLRLLGEIVGGSASVTPF